MLTRTEIALDQDSLLRAVHWLCNYHGLSLSEAALRSGIPSHQVLTPTLAVRVLEGAGIGAGWVRRSAADLLGSLFPVVLLRKDGGACILLARREEKKGVIYDVIFPEAGGGGARLHASEVEEMYDGHALLAKPYPRLDERAGPIELQAQKHWLFSTLWRYRRFYANAALAALLVNILTLASTFFTMTVYDRVVPNQAYVTLWSLAIGVATAVVFEFCARQARSHLVEAVGRKIDLVLGALLFGKLMSVRMEHKPASAGSSANQLREFESLRDFATSATVATLSDLPFCLLFVGVIGLIGGPLALVPVVCIPLVIALSLGIQWPLARLMQQHLHEGSLKQGLLIEAIEGIETLKTVHGVGVMQRKWEDFSALAASSSAKARALSSLALNLVTLIQQLQSVFIVVWGVYLIHGGSLSLGALIGVVILAGRTISPLASVVSLAVRLQQARASFRSLDHLMKTPSERSSERHYLSKFEFGGNISLRAVGFSYPSTARHPTPAVLRQINLDILSGERIGVLGNVGSGKSTLLRLMASLYQPTSGQVLLDGIDVQQIDPADVRRAIGLLGQDPRLFHGSLRENVLIGSPGASDDEFLLVARLTGIDVIAARHPMGYDMAVGEGGRHLSGGERQLVALARCLLLRPSVLLMDEPSSAMDLQTERYFLDRMARATEGHTVVIATHRPSLLELVDRIIVLDGEGRVFADGPKQVVLDSLRARGASN